MDTRTSRIKGLPSKNVPWITAKAFKTSCCKGNDHDP